MKIVDERTIDVYSVKLLDNGILHAHTSDEKPETVSKLKEAVIVLGEMVNHKKAPMLNTRCSFALPSPEVREFWAKKESCPYISAEAFVTNSLAFKIIFQFYLKQHKPERPTQLFPDQDSAIIWLKTFL